MRRPLCLERPREVIEVERLDFNQVFLKLCLLGASHTLNDRTIPRQHVSQDETILSQGYCDSGSRDLRKISGQILRSPAVPGVYIASTAFK